VDYLLPLLDNSDKLQLLTEIRYVLMCWINWKVTRLCRSVLEAPDLATFDELVSPREAEMLMKAQGMVSHHQSCYYIPHCFRQPTT